MTFNSSCDYSDVCRQGRNPCLIDPVTVVLVTDGVQPALPDKVKNNSIILFGVS